MRTIVHSSPSGPSTTLMRCIHMRSRLARTAFFQSTMAPTAPFVSRIVSSITYAAFFLAYRINRVSKCLPISSRFQGSRGIHEMRIFRKEREQLFGVVLFESTEKIFQRGQRRIMTGLRFHACRSRVLWQLLSYLCEFESSGVQD